MQLDQHMLNRLLSMNDDQLSSVIRQIATEAGIDPAMLGINPNQIQSIRQALSSATNEDLQKYNRIYQDYKKGRQR